MTCESEQNEQADEDVVLSPPSPARILPWLAALSSARVPYRVVEDGECWEIRVAPTDIERARKEVAEYERVNRDWPPPGEAPPDMEPLSPAAVWTSLCAAVALVAFHTVTGPVEGATIYFARGAAATSRIVSGEWWRVVTSLCLHADSPHVLGNAACAVFFSLGVARHTGVGVAWFAILLSGAAGNLAAAGLQGSHHVAIGASTATFGALGMLSALQFANNYRRDGKLRTVFSRTWTPIAAAAAILALLGAGPGTDLAGHFCGLVAGAALGAIAGVLKVGRLPGWAQAVFGLAGLAVVGAAWFFALGPVPDMAP